MRLGIPTTRLKSYELGRAPIRYALAAKVGVEFDISQQWLAAGTLPIHPHFIVADEMECRIPARWLFSQVYDKLLHDLIEAELKGMAEVTGVDKSEIRKVSWLLSQVGLGASQDTQKGYRSMHFQTMVAQHLTRFPLDLYEQFDSRLQGFLESFEAEHQEKINDFLKAMDSNPLAEFQIEKIRDFVAQKLGVPPDELPDRPPQPKPSLSTSQHIHFTKADIQIEKSVLTYVGNTDIYCERYEQTQPVNMQKNHIATRIKKARKQLGVSQREAAEKWGFPVQTIQQWEHGRREPRALYAEKIESILAEIERASKTHRREVK